MDAGCRQAFNFSVSDQISGPVKTFSPNDETSSIYRTTSFANSDGYMAIYL